MRRIHLFSALFFAASLAGVFGQTPGTLKWRLTLDGDVSYSSLALAPDGTLYAARHNVGGGGSLWAIDTTSVPAGTSASATPYARWALEFTNTDGCLDTPAIGADGSIYLGTDLTGFSALNPTNGGARWVYNDAQLQTYGISGSPAIGGDGTVYVGIWQNLLALTNSPGPTNSQPLWMMPFPTGYPNVISGFGGGFQYASSVVGADGTIYLNTDYGQLLAVDPANGGSFKWVTILPDLSGYAGSGGSSSAAIGSDGTIYFGAANYFFAVDPAAGDYKWSYQTLPTDSFQTSPAIGPDGNVYVEVFGLTNRLYAFKPDGSVIWTNTLAVLQSQTVDTVAKQGSCAVAADGELYVSDTDGSLYSFNTSTGATNWVYATGNSGLNAPVIGPDGTIYVQSYEGSQPYLYAIYGSAPVADSSWPEFRQNAQRTAAAVASSSPVNVTVGSPVMTTNGLQFTLSGPAGQTVDIQASTDLVHWTTIGSLVLTGGIDTFVDHSTTAYTSRYYRVVAGSSSGGGAVTLSLPSRNAGGFHFTVTGPAGQTASIDASADLVTWTNIGSVLLTGGSGSFVDSTATNFPVRFYRASSP